MIETIRILGVLRGVTDPHFFRAAPDPRERIAAALTYNTKSGYGTTAISAAGSSVTE
jgi:hypothetical protein